MIRVTIELIPGGWEKSPRRKEIGRLELANTGEGNAELGNYKATLFRRGTTKTIRKETVVYGHKRRTQEIWRLLARALWALGYRGDK